MKREDAAALAEFYDADGELFGRTLAAEWMPPEKVELAGGVLTIRSCVDFWTGANQGTPIRAPRGLLDRFGALADASDEKIRSFATQYGGLQIFYSLAGESHWPTIEHSEYCEVWRYFARTMRALQRIASDQYRGGSGSNEDWQVIHQVPPLMRQTARESNHDFLRPFPLGDERNWGLIGSFCWQTVAAKQSHVWAPHQYSAGSRRRAALAYLA